MKGYYTSKLLQDKFYQSLIFSYMDKFLLIGIRDGYMYTKFNHEFNEEGEFIYRAIHPKQSAFDTYYQLEMRVNDDGVFIEDIKHRDFTDAYLHVLNRFKKKCEKEEAIVFSK